MMRAGGKGIDIEGAENRTEVLLCPKRCPVDQSTSPPNHQTATSLKPPNCQTPKALSSKVMLWSAQLLSSLWLCRSGKNFKRITLATNEIQLCFNQRNFSRVSYVPPESFFLQFHKLDQSFVSKS